jgi:uncharacterized protein (TIGR00299 family) protein
MSMLYLDLFSGISGDMFLGALLDLGVPFDSLERELAKLGLKEYHLHAAPQKKAMIAGVKFDVHLASSHAHHHAHHHAEEAHHEHGHTDHDHPHAPAAHSQDAVAAHSHSHSRNYGQIRHLIEESPYSPWVKAKSTAIFHRIAEAEGKIHGCGPDRVHFHEVGAVDSIVDIVGACLALEMLDKPRVLASAVVEGVGWILCEHGRFPLPAPATLAILGARGIPITQCDEPHELVTPTGAAILAEFAESFAPMACLVPSKIGYGIGSRDNKTRPNVLRAILSHDSTASNDWEMDSVAVLETNLDDLNPEILGYFLERALAAGALDVFYTPVHMKKNRPGVLLTVLCPAAQGDILTELILRETSAFGVRRSLCERRKLRREFRTVNTPFGPVTVKMGRLNDSVLQAAPEFESCRQLAAQFNLPLKDIYEAAIGAAKKSVDAPPTVHEQP